jgi:hypothetical protein
MGEWRYKYTSTGLGTRWRCHLLHAPTALPRRYQLERRLDGLQSRYGRCGEETNLATLGIEREPSSLWQLSIATKLRHYISLYHQQNLTPRS